MSSILSFLLSYLLLYKYTALFLVVFSAAVILPLPIDITLIAVGAFSSQGFFDFKMAVFVALSANFLGDLIDYAIFRKYGHIVVRERYIKKYSFFLNLEEYFKKHSGFTIFISRFVGVLGPMVNFISGYVGVSPIKFIIYDLLGNFIEITLLVVIGYFIGDYWNNISGLVTTVGSLLVVVVVSYIIYSAYQNKYEKKD
ncbi:MAG: DedA family protein [bacterium]